RVLKTCRPSTEQKALTLTLREALSWSGEGSRNGLHGKRARATLRRQRENAALLRRDRTAQTRAGGREPVPILRRRATARAPADPVLSRARLRAQEDPVRRGPPGIRPRRGAPGASGGVAQGTGPDGRAHPHDRSDPRQ